MKEYYALSRLSGDLRGDICIDRIFGSKSMWLNNNIEIMGKARLFHETYAVITRDAMDYAVVDSGEGNFVQATSIIYHGEIKLNIAAFGFNEEHALRRLRKFLLSELEFINSTNS